MAIFVKHNSLILFSFTLSLGVGCLQALPAQASEHFQQSATPNRFDFDSNFWPKDGPTGSVDRALCIEPKAQVRRHSVPQMQFAGDRSFLQTVRPALVTQSVQVVQRASTVQAAPSPQYIPSPPVQPLSAQPVAMQPNAPQPRIVCGDGEVYIYQPVSPPKASTPLGAPANRGVRPGANSRVSARLMPSNDVAKVPAMMTYGSKGYSLGAANPSAYAAGSGVVTRTEVSGKVRPKGK